MRAETRRHRGCGPSPDLSAGCGRPRDSVPSRDWQDLRRRGPARGPASALGPRPGGGGGGGRVSPPARGLRGEGRFASWARSRRRDNDRPARRGSGGRGPGLRGLPRPGRRPGSWCSRGPAGRRSLQPDVRARVGGPRWASRVPALRGDRSCRGSQPARGLPPPAPRARPESPAPPARLPCRRRRYEPVPCPRPRPGDSPRRHPRPKPRCGGWWKGAPARSTPRRRRLWGGLPRTPGRRRASP